MTTIERLQTSLTSLGLKAVEPRLENLLERASKEAPSYADFLDQFLSCEVEARRTRYLRARLQLARLPFLMFQPAKWANFIRRRGFPTTNSATLISLPRTLPLTSFS